MIPPPWITIILITLQDLPLGWALIGYDCGGAATNITTVSLLEVGECIIPQQEVNVTQKYIQLIQLNQYAGLQVMQCKVEIYRVIRRCGMFSHTSDVLNGEYSYIEHISHDNCKQMHREGTIKIGKTHITGISRNTTTSRPIAIAGSVAVDGTCEGVDYSDPVGVWEKVFVKGTVRITLQEYRANVDVDSNKVHLLSGMRCPLNEGHCLDMEGGDTYWEPYPEDTCRTKRYGLLYEGLAQRTIETDSTSEQTIYSMTEGEIVFALTAKRHTHVCGYKLIQTEHPKLIIVEIEKDNPFMAKEFVSASNMDLFAYVNSKFVYVEKHIRTELKRMYRDILMQRCNLERRVLQNALTIARRAPDEFAYNLMKGPGYMALIAGEVAHIIRCIPVNVKLMATKECYDQLPVQRNNVTYYFAPRTHILTKLGVQITCNRLVAPMYLYKGSWYNIGPDAVAANPPMTIKPFAEPTWHYRNPHELATSGIYTLQDLEALREHIMFPAERPAILNSLARGMVGQPTIDQGSSISNLLDDQSIKKIIDSTWTKTWGYLALFGNVSAGLIGFLLVCRLIKFIFDTIIHGYALHTVYGWSLYLIGAIWDSVTFLLLHLSRSPPPDGYTRFRRRSTTEGVFKSQTNYLNALYTKREKPSMVPTTFGPREGATRQPSMLCNAPDPSACASSPRPENSQRESLTDTNLSQPLSFVWASPGLGTSVNPVASISKKDKRRARVFEAKDLQEPGQSNTQTMYPNLRPFPGLGINDHNEC